MTKSHAVVTSCSHRWARVRVRGLMHNPALADRIRGASVNNLHIGLDTGSVPVPLTPQGHEAFWADWLSAHVAAHTTARGGRRRYLPLPPRTTAQRTTRTDESLPQRPAARAAGPGVQAPTPHSTPIDRLLAELGGARPIDVERGLTAADARVRLARDGANEIRDITGRSTSEILLDQIKSVPVALLGGSAALALATRAFADAGAIGAVLAANATLGFVTERRAEETVSSLRKMSPRQATVLRDGAEVTIDAREVVAGDVLVLKPGEPVAADARVVQAHRLATNEAALTGESLPVRKEPVASLPEAAPLGERRNMVFLGTVVSGGAGRAVVVATAERAALGRIRQLAQATEAPRTQLQQELDTLGRRLAIGAASLCVGVFALGALRG